MLRTVSRIRERSSADGSTASAENATESMAAAECSGFTGNANDDVWFSFAATTADMTVAATGVPGFDVVLEVLGGTCGSLATVGTCSDATLGGETETVELTGLEFDLLRVVSDTAGTSSSTRGV